ncbi:DUF1580 domain-containing protein [Zavarzinella formosa]|uniref:DUF1580 domain-containing protein n=1 Tax=Zavarzinella formosa TaxID=360055 RepID=UPI0002D2F6CB|nr:DUF1580 domain-containing protein [Zavarzinella formosa]
MLEVSDEHIPLAEMGKHLPKSIPPPHISTCVRWALRGVGSPRIRLETMKIGGRRFTTKAAIARFITRLSTGGAVETVETAGRTRAFYEAERGLDEEGI